MNAKQANSEKDREALGRLLHIAVGNTGQARKVADFLLAWHNAEENGGWDPVDLWSVDAAIADDILAVLQLIRASHCYPPDLGFDPEITAVWELWRGKMAPNSSPKSPRMLPPGSRRLLLT
jgi:hypothetical protein